MALGFSPALEIHVIETGPVSFYTGVNGSFVIATQWTGYGDDRRTDVQKGFSAGALIGADVFILDNLSLGVESEFGIESRSTTSSIGDEKSTGPSTFTIGFRLPVRLSVGLHI